MLRTKENMYTAVVDNFSALPGRFHAAKQIAVYSGFSFCY